MCISHKVPLVTEISFVMLKHTTHINPSQDERQRSNLMEKGNMHYIQVNLVNIQDTYFPHVTKTPLDW